MGAIDTILARLGYVKGTGAPTGAGLFAPRTSSGNGWGIPTYPLTFTGWPDRATTAQTLTPMQALLTSWVYSDVQVLSREFQSPPLDIKELDGEDTIDVPNHAFERLWSRPNPYMSKSYLMAFWMHSMLLAGKAALYFAPRGNSGEIAEIWPLPPMQFRAIGDAKDFISGYVFKARPDSDPITIDPKYICYSRLPNPMNLREGLAPLDAAMSAVVLDQSQANWARGFFGNRRAVPDAIVQLPREIGEAEFQTIKTQVLEGLFGNGVGLGFARAGDIDIKAFGFDMQKVQQIESRQFSRDEIDRVFGIPEGYWTADATRANSDHAGDAVLSNVVHPYHVMLAEDLTAQVLPVFYGEQYVAEFEDVRPRNVDLELRQIDRRMKYWTIDELRAEDGLDPIGESGDEKNQRPDPRGRLLVAEVGAASAPSATQPQATPTTPDGKPATDAPTDAATPTTAPNTAPTENVQQAALNGAQVQALVDLITAVGAQQLPPQSAIEIIANAFPTIQRDSIERMVNAAKDQPPPKPEPQPVPPNLPPNASQNAPASENEPSKGEMPNETPNAPKKALPVESRGLSDEAYADLERWQTKALKALKAGKPAAVKFESAHLPRDLFEAVSERLSQSAAIGDVRGLFAAAPFLKREPSDALTPAERELYDAIEPVLARWGGEVSSLIRKDGKVDYDAMGDDLRTALHPLLEAHILRQLSERNTAYGIDAGAFGENAATTWAKDYSFDLVKGLNDTTREVVQRAVSDYTATPGMTRGELEERLQPAFGELRASSIAVTETTRAAAAATDTYQAALTEMGYKSVKVWQTANDDLVCPVCGPLNGLPESEWGEVDDAPAHVNCRCATTLRIEKNDNA